MPLTSVNVATDLSENTTELLSTCIVFLGYFGSKFSLCALRLIVYSKRKKLNIICTIIKIPYIVAWVIYCYLLNMVTLLRAEPFRVEGVIDARVSRIHWLVHKGLSGIIMIYRLLHGLDLWSIQEQYFLFHLYCCLSNGVSVSIV